MSRKQKPVRSDIAWSTPDQINVRGRDLPSEILGKLNLGDMAFLELTARMPTPQESVMFNALVVTLVEHGVTPSALAARLDLRGCAGVLASGGCRRFMWFGHGVRRQHGNSRKNAVRGPAPGHR
jgi:citrate synthase